MDELTILRGIVDSYPYPIVFVDDTYTIRFLNRYAQYHYYQERGYRDLVGRACSSATTQRPPKSGSRRPLRR